MKNSGKITTFLLALACTLPAVLTVLYLSVLPRNRHNVTNRDFIVYWATGQQLVHHGNPYDPVAIGRVEHAAGYTGEGAYFMRNAPWALPFALPLSLLSPQAAALPWSLAMLCLLAVSVRTMWKILGSPEGHLDWLGYCFPPALFCVSIGQTSTLLLFGLVLFLRWHKTRPFAAGAALWFCTLKPHLFLPFALILLVWIVVERRFRILAGGIAAMAVGSMIMALVDPAAWPQYVHYMRTSGITHEFTANLGDLLRDSIHPSWDWIAFVPAIAGCLWALAWYWHRRRRWDWIEHGSLLMLVSLVVAPFGWIFDQSLAIPAILFAVTRAPSRAALATLAVLYVAVEVQLFSSIRMASHAYLWTAPAWLIWYLFARITPGSSGTEQAPAAAFSMQNISH